MRLLFKASTLAPKPKTNVPISRPKSPSTDSTASNLVAGSYEAVDRVEQAVLGAARHDHLFGRHAESVFAVELPCLGDCGRTATGQASREGNQDGDERELHPVYK